VQGLNLSPLATQIISRIRNPFRVQAPPFFFLETPMISGVAVKIGQRSMVQTDEGEMARLFQAWKGFLRTRVVTMEIKRNTAPVEPLPWHRNPSIALSPT
jgi:hypothetical protein